VVFRLAYELNYEEKCEQPQQDFLLHDS
jgi:hypothetical protein